MQLCGKLYQNIKTYVKDEAYPNIELGIEPGKGFHAIYIKDAGVFELQSGGLIGDTTEDVKLDIANFTDIKFIQSQVQSAIAECEKATIVSNKEFFNKQKGE